MVLHTVCVCPFVLHVYACAIALNRFRAGLDPIPHVDGAGECEASSPHRNTTDQHQTPGTSRPKFFGVPPFGHMGRQVFPLFESRLQAQTQILEKGLGLLVVMFDVMLMFDVDV